MLENEFEKEFSDDGFWEKLKKFAKSAGENVLGSALNLYYSAQDPDTPAWAKATMYGALGYFILPIDAIPDPVPLIGFSDDLGVLVAATTAVAIHIKKEHKEKSKEKLKQWFD